jgi:hypothetical protein
MCELVSPICAIHQPGVIVEFSSDEAVVPLFTGAQTEVLDCYWQAFNRILEVVGRRQRSNLQLRQSSLRDHYEIKKLHRLIRSMGKRLENTWFLGLSNAERVQLLRAAANNRFSFPNSKNKSRVQILRRSVCEHQAFLAIDNRFRSHVLFDQATIPVAMRRGLEGWLHLRSNRRSVTQFWIGTGALDLSYSVPKAHILPPSRASQIWPQVSDIPVSSVQFEGFCNVPVFWKASQHQEAET